MGFGEGISCDIRLNTALTQQQRELYQNTKAIRNILSECRTVAMVGLSSDRYKASYFVASYLRAYGYRVIPVNPGADTILGEKAWPDLASVPEKVDLVDVFRPASECPPITEEAIKIGARAIWFQLRIINLEAADRALRAGLYVVVDRCVKMEHGRFSGGLHDGGFNTELISAKRAVFSGLRDHGRGG